MDSPAFEIISSIPHSADDINTGEPIKFRLGNLRLKFPTFPYKKSRDFDRATKGWALEALNIPGMKSPPDLQDIMDQEGEDSPKFLSMSGEEKLPAYIMSFVEPINFKDCARKLSNWIDQAKTEFDLPLDDIELEKIHELKTFRKILTIYLMYAHTWETLINLLSVLVYLNSNIKKKVLKALQEGFSKEENSTVPRWQASRAALDWHQKKLSLKSHSSKSSP